MYFLAKKESKAALYTTNEEAQRFLFTLHAKLSNQEVVILDYLLEPNRCQLLLETKKTVTLPTFHLKPIAKEELLWFFSALSPKGKTYPYSGLYECYFISTCFCELGKVSSTPLPYTLKEVLRVKNDRAR